jgi:hypothetical protein
MKNSSATSSVQADQSKLAPQDFDMKNSSATSSVLSSATSSVLSSATSSAQQQPARASFPAKPGQVWQIDVTTPSGAVRWKLAFTGTDKDGLPTGTSEIKNFKGAAEWNNMVGQKSKGFVFTEPAGRFSGSTGVWVCVFPRYVDELFSNSLVGTAAYQDSSGLTGSTQCQATLLEDANPVAAIPTPPAFDAKSILPPKPGQRWQIKLSNAETVRLQLIGYVTTTMLEGRLEGNNVSVGGFEHPSGTVQTSLGVFYLRQGSQSIAQCSINTDSKLEVTGDTYAITGYLLGGGACVVSFSKP